jgi:hypothetical protein
MIPNAPVFETVNDGVVDGEPWLCVRVSTRRGDEICHWLREHNAVEVTTKWAFDAYFEMPEKLYMMLVLKFR